jgi:hypothetical protein
MGLSSATVGSEVGRRACYPAASGERESSRRPITEKDHLDFAAFIGAKAGVRIEKLKSREDARGTQAKTPNSVSLSSAHTAAANSPTDYN